jgi:hypothetical protein
MIRAAALLLFATALTLLVATGCSKSPDVSNPKAEAPKDRAPLQPLQPGGVPGAKGGAPKAGPGTSSQ